MDDMTNKTNDATPMKEDPRREDLPERVLPHDGRSIMDQAFDRAEARAAVRRTLAGFRQCDHRQILIDLLADLELASEPK
jgi:hypothetical protein